MKVSGWTYIAVLVKQKTMLMKYCDFNELFFCVIILLIEMIKCVLPVRTFSVSTVST